jgi:hypothetical protein
MFRETTRLGRIVTTKANKANKEGKTRLSYRTLFTFFALFAFAVKFFVPFVIAHIRIFSPGKIPGGRK